MEKTKVKVYVYATHVIRLLLALDVKINTENLVQVVNLYLKCLPSGIDADITFVAPEKVHMRRDLNLEDFKGSIDIIESHFDIKEALRETGYHLVQGGMAKLEDGKYIEKGTIPYLAGYVYTALCSDPGMKCVLIGVPRDINGIKDDLALYAESLRVVHVELDYSIVNQDQTIFVDQGLKEGLQKFAA